MIKNRLTINWRILYGRGEELHKAKTLSEVQGRLVGRASYNFFRFSRCFHKFYLIQQCHRHVHPGLMFLELSYFIVWEHNLIVVFFAEGKMSEPLPSRCTCICYMINPTTN